MKPAMGAFSERVSHNLLKSALRLTQGAARRNLLEASKSPGEAQASVLQSILSDNQDTEFGRLHDFAKITNAADFRVAVPVQTYEDLRPYIDRQELTGERCLTGEPPVYYNRTSGTVGLPKDIPVTRSGLDRIRNHQRLLAFGVSRGTNALFGKIFGITGQAEEGRMSGGAPYGSASGLLYKSQSRLVSSRYVLPPEVSEISDYDTRYLVMAIFGLVEPNVTCLGTANPSTLVRLLTIINQNTDLILEAIGTGHLPIGEAQSNDLRLDLKPDRERSRQLEEIVNSQGRLRYTDIWPRLAGLMVWTGGSCSVPLKSLAPSIPESARIVELGYVASEVNGTVNIDPANNICLPTLRDTFFEFVERDNWETGEREFLSLDELEHEGEYYVFVTTSDGLYRYDMNDIVRVTGKFNETPVIEFVQKGKGVTSITGEKLYEAQVLDAVDGAAAGIGCVPSFFVVLADQETAGYTTYLETAPDDRPNAPDLAAEVDQRLQQLNIEYAGKRDSGRLTQMTVKLLRTGTGEVYRSSRIANGQRDAQFKYLHLQYAHECPFNFARYVEGSGDYAN